MIASGQAQKNLKTFCHKSAGTGIYSTNYIRSGYDRAPAEKDSGAFMLWAIAPGKHLII